MKATIPTLCLSGAIAVLCGCASQSSHLDQQFGKAVQASTRQQILNPDAPTTALVSGLDGKAGKSAYDNYLKSFKDPVPQTGALAIGVGR